MLLLIAKASSETIKYKKFSESECDSALGLLKFKLEVVQFPKTLAGASFKLGLQEKQNENSYLAICSLEDNLLEQFISSTDEAKDISLTCTFYAEIPEQTLNLNVLYFSNFEGDLFDLIKDDGGNNELTLNILDCSNIDSEQRAKYYQEKKVSLRLASNYQFFEEEKKMTFKLSILTSQILPSKYTIPIFFTKPPNSETDESLQLIGYCILNDQIKPSENEILSTNLDCIFENYERFYIEMGTYSFEFPGFIMGIPYEFGLLNPTYSDGYLESNIINDFSVEPIPPIFTPESINTKYCEKYGIITIKGKFNDNIEGVDFKVLFQTMVFFNVFLMVLKRIKK